MALYGEKRCGEIIDRLTGAAKDALTDQFVDTAFLCALADSLAKRKN